MSYRIFYTQMHSIKTRNEDINVTLNVVRFSQSCCHYRKMTQITDGDLFWLLAICGSVLGIVLNSYLIASLISKWKKYPFACLFTATALFDLIFSLVEVSTQHVSLYLK